MEFTNRHGLRFQIALLALATAASVCVAQTPVSSQATPTSAAADSAAPTDAPAAPVAPPDAPTLPPKVVCTGDQMTISANNSTLSSVLAEVHRCMGTKIDLPDGAGEKRMFDRIGPGPASQVIDELLSNTGYNYIVGASPADQEKIESIVLLARVTDATTLATTVTDGRTPSPNRRAFMQMHQAAIPHPMTEADTAAAAEAAAPPSTPAPATTPASTAAPADATTPQPASTDGQPAAPAADPNQKPADTAPAAQPDTPPTPPPNVTEINGKPATTQDQITNMQQMFELRKQLNQAQPQNQPPQ
jgi:hypothetical protein